jgi:hypothetical protein
MVQVLSISSRKKSHPDTALMWEEIGANATQNFISRLYLVDEGTNAELRLREAEMYRRVTTVPFKARGSTSAHPFEEAMRKEAPWPPQRWIVLNPGSYGVRCFDILRELRAFIKSLGEQEPSQS